MPEDLDSVLGELERALAFVNRSANDTRLFARQLYVPDPRLTAELDVLRRFQSSESPSPADRQLAGRALERLLFLAFRGLRGWSSLKSYRSTPAQIDLLVSGSDAAWLVLCGMTRIDKNLRGILIEAKAYREPVGDPEMERLCALIHHHYPSTVGLGILATLNGITGGSGRVLRDARFTQVVFHRTTRIPLVVLSLEHLERLAEPGGLPVVLEEEIRQLEELAPMPAPGSAPTEVELPPHLRELW